jgi:sarcosine oxidase subunit gamma
VAEFVWTPRSPLQHALVPGAYGAGGTAGIALTEIRNFALAQVMARRGRSSDLAAAAQAHFGVATPYGPEAVEAGGVTLIWSGPDQFLVLSRGGGDGALMESLQQPFSGLASLTDQSHARVMIRVGGPQARAMLAKLSSIDLHPQAFPPSAAAATSIDHTSVNLWRGNDPAEGPASFNLLVFATFAESLWHTMLDSAAEYGVDIRAPEDLA